MKDDRQPKRKPKSDKKRDFNQYDEESLRKFKTTKDFKRKKQSLQEEDSWEDDWTDYLK